MKNKKNILYITNADGRLGGAKSLIEVISGIREYEVNPIVITPIKNEINDFCVANKIDNYVVPFSNYMYSKNNIKIVNYIKKVLFKFRYYYMLFNSLKKIKKLINFEEINYIHTNTSVVDFGAVLSKKYGIKHIWHLREFGDLDFNLESIRNNYIDYMNKNTSYFIAISNAVRNNWINKGIDSSKIRTIYNGIKLDDIVQKEYNHLSNKDNKFRIVFSGAITNNKGQIHLINALNLLDDKMMKNIYVDFIGNYDFKYYEYLMTIVKKNHYSNNINFLGYCKNIRKEICKYDVGICCSKSEAFGRVTVEYMAAGIPVIGSNTGSNLELITNSVGYLYDYNNDDSLTEVISYCYNNRNELQKKGIQAKSTVYNKYNTKINVKNIFELYCSI